MSAVLVHGVPETPAVWEPLRAHLDLTDVVALQLPGFGCSLNLRLSVIAHTPSPRGLAPQGGLCGLAG